MRILITGGTGTLGQALIRKLLSEADSTREKISEIRVLSRNERDQAAMKRDLESSVEFSIGDVRDYEAIFRLTKGFDVIIHAAAIKHIDVAESNPEEAFKTNVVGTKNILKAASRHEVRKLVNISTDKTCNPHSTYGATKLIAERLTSAVAFETKSNFITCRFGNILGSSGSVFSFWKTSINQNKKVKITHRDMTRFFISIDSAAQFVLDSLEESFSGSILVPKLNSFSMAEIASLIIGSDKEESVEVIGLRPGEKIHEDLVNESEFQRADFYADFLELPPETSKISTSKTANFHWQDFNEIKEGCLRSNVTNNLETGTERFSGKYAMTNSEMLAFIGQIE